VDVLQKVDAHRKAGFDFVGGRRLDPEQWAMLQDWLLANPDARFRKGDVLPDGLVFYGYRRKSRGGVYACPKKVLDKDKEHRASMNDPAYQALAKFRAATKVNTRSKFKRWYAKTRSQSARRGIEFSLTEDEAWELYGQNCFYCGKQPADNDSWGLDRMINTLGYHEDNVVPCCKTCNYCKGPLDTLDFLTAVSDIAFFRK
jgi:hypothetical protein